MLVGQCGGWNRKVSQQPDQAHRERRDSQPYFGHIPPVCQAATPYQRFPDCPPLVQKCGHRMERKKPCSVFRQGSLQAVWKFPCRLFNGHLTGRPRPPAGHCITHSVCHHPKPANLRSYSFVLAVMVTFVRPPFALRQRMNQCLRTPLYPQADNVKHDKSFRLYVCQ